MRPGISSVNFNMLKYFIVLLSLLAMPLQAAYSAVESGIAMGNLAATAQNGDSYANVPGVYFVLEDTLVTSGPVIVLAKPLVSENVSNWTNQPVQITLVNNNPATWNVVLQYHLNDVGQWHDYVGPFVVTGNTILTARAFSPTLNVSEEISVTINNIDIDIPHLVVTANAVDMDRTRYQIHIAATDDTSGIKEIVNPDGVSITASDASYIVTQSGVYNFSVTDFAGNKVQYAMAVTINQIETFSGATTTTITRIARPLAYPSIFDPGKQNTRLYFELQSPGAVAVRIYSIGGVLVNTLTLDAVAGINYVEWAGNSNFRSDRLDSGVYLFYVLSNGGKVLGRGKVLLMRER